MLVSVWILMLLRLWVLSGELFFALPENISVTVENSIISVERFNEEKKTRSLHGLSRALINNMVKGVTLGFKKTLEVIGVGYKILLEGRTLVLHLGFSHLVNLDIPDGLSVNIDPKKKNIIDIVGIDKCLVGEFSAIIRKLKKPEPYKGKGIRYLGEFVQRKAGKSASK
jgi:large subunit ribosomal protein L6